MADTNSESIEQQQQQAQNDKASQQQPQQSDSQQQQQNAFEQNTIDEIDEDRGESISLDKQRQIELEEERKLKAKHPCVQRPGSEFLQKRLQRGQKYFDSGDYNMAKASPTNPNVIKLPEGATPMPAIDSKILNRQRH